MSIFNKAAQNFILDASEYIFRRTENTGQKPRWCDRGIKEAIYIGWILISGYEFNLQILFYLVT